MATTKARPTPGPSGGGLIPHRPAARSLQLAISLALCLQGFACTQVPPSAKAADPCPRTSEMPSGYRMDHYRRPTPSCAPGAITVDTAEVLSLKAHKPDLLLIDVWALLLRAEPGFGSEWLPTEVHLSLPDAIWLPNVGLGAPQPLVAEWFITQLNAKTGGNRDRALVFFCVADCWMSWNAAIRARELGYRQVYWYRDGTSGWQEAGQRLAPLSPEPIDGY